jgi:phosphoserine phosphatase
VRFASVVLDVDSTLCGVEGIDWLAQRRGTDVAERIRALTDRAMNGEIALDAVYGERLALIEPTRDDIEALAKVYRQTLAPDAAATIAQLRRDRVAVVLVSGGIRQAIAPVARELDVPLHAVDLRFDDGGRFVEFDQTSPLTTQMGKRDIVKALALPRPLLAVGDGSTDVAMKDVADQLVAFTGFARREQVVREAHGEVSSFTQLLQVVRGDRVNAGSFYPRAH